jgi:hypothetical protein
VGGKADGIEWVELGDTATAHLNEGTISIYPITSEVTYAVALHEIGHIRQGHNDDVMICERAAWKWARTTALVWTPTMEREAKRLLKTYEPTEKFKDREQYYYEQVRACVGDLLAGYRSLEGEDEILVPLCNALSRIERELTKLTYSSMVDYPPRPSEEDAEQCNYFQEEETEQ